MGYSLFFVSVCGHIGRCSSLITDSVIRNQSGKNVKGHNNTSDGIWIGLVKGKCLTYKFAIFKMRSKECQNLNNGYHTWIFIFMDLCIYAYITVVIIFNLFLYFILHIFNKFPHWCSFLKCTKPTKSHFLSTFTVSLSLIFCNCFLASCWMIVFYESNHNLLQVGEESKFNKATLKNLIGDYNPTIVVFLISFHPFKVELGKDGKTNNKLKQMHINFSFIISSVRSLWRFWRMLMNARIL